jgi:hypothetical protein
LGDLGRKKGGYLVCRHACVLASLCAYLLLCLSRCCDDLIND